MTLIITTHLIEDEYGREIAIRRTWTPDTLTEEVAESADDMEIVYT